MIAILITANGLVPTLYNENALVGGIPLMSLLAEASGLTSVGTVLDIKLGFTEVLALIATLRPDLIISIAFRTGFYYLSVSLFSAVPDIHTTLFGTRADTVFIVDEP